MINLTISGMGIPAPNSHKSTTCNHLSPTIGSPAQCHRHWWRNCTLQYWLPTPMRTRHPNNSTPSKTLQTIPKRYQNGNMIATSQALVDESGIIIFHNRSRLRVPFTMNIYELMPATGLSTSRRVCLVQIVLVQSRIQLQYMRVKAIQYLSLYNVVLTSSKQKMTWDHMRWQRFKNSRFIPFFQNALHIELLLRVQHCSLAEFLKTHFRSGKRGWRLNLH